MIVHINDYGRDRLVKASESNLVKGILVAQENILDNERLEMLIE